MSVFTKAQVRYLLNAVKAADMRTSGYSEDPFVSEIEAKLSVMLDLAPEIPGATSRVVAETVYRVKVTR